MDAMDGHTDRRSRRGAANQFWVVGRLGSGGLGVVYDAIDLRARRRVALKVLRHGRTDPASARHALEHEAAAMTLARGPRVCRTYGLAECGGQPCLVMERLIGCTLQARLSVAPMSIETAIDTGVQIAAALETIHRAGLVHADLKPANMFITDTGRIKILDFGLAVHLDAGEAGRHARRRADQHVLGTASYISPERILRAPIDHRSDLFSFGAVLYEMAFGRSPFAGASPADTLFKVLESDPPPTAAAGGTPAAAVDALARLLLEKNPARRCQSAADVRRALTHIRTAQPRTSRVTRVDHSLQMRGGSHEFVHVPVA
jgi:serine/threonine protein kinase